MAEFDHGIKMIAETAGRQLARLAGVESAAWRPAESTVQSVERLADRVFLAGRGRRRFAVYFEFYTTWDRNAPWDMLAKSGLISQRERVPTVCIAVVLRRQRFRTTGGQLRLEAAGGPTQQLWFKEVCLWRLKPEAWWEDEPGLMALYPLCEHGRRPQDAVRHAVGVIEAKVAGQVERADVLALLDVFAGLAYPRLNVEGIIGSEKMKESRLWRQARQEGELVAKRESVCQVLQARFGPDAASELGSALEEIDEASQLRLLLDRAAICDSVESFRAALPAPRATS